MKYSYTFCSTIRAASKLILAVRATTKGHSIWLESLQAFLLRKPVQLVILMESQRRYTTQ